MVDRTVVYRLQADIAGFEANMKNAGASVRKAADDMTSATKEGAKFRAGLDTLGGTAGKVGLATAAGLAASAKAAMDWESAWAGVTKTVDGSAAQMSELETGLRNLAKTMPATHEEIAGVAEAAGQLGVAREDILDFTKTMIDLSETTNLTAEEAATSIAQISNVMGTSGNDVDNFGAALVALGNAGASTESQILDMTQRIAGAGAQIGLAETDILAIANAAASMGIEAEAGGSAISRVFTELAKATSSGGPKLEQFAQIAGMTGEEFVAAFGDDPAQAFNSFTKGLDRVNKSGGDVFSTLKELGLSDVRVSQALLGMAASGDLLTDSLNLGKTAWEENTALAIEAAKRYDTTASQTQVAWNQIKDAGIDAGEALLPVVAGVAETVGEMADAFGNLPGPVQRSVTGLAGITAVLGGGLWFTAKVVNGVTEMKGALDNLGISGDKTATKLGKVGRAAGVMGATLASIAILDSLQRQFDGLDTGLEGITRQLLELGNGDTGNLSGEFNDIADSFDRLTDPNKAQAFQDSIYDTMGFLGSDSRVDKAVAQFEAIDAGLTNITATAGSGAAQKVFDSLAASMGLNADEQQRLVALMPQYQDALEGAKNDADLKALSDEDAAAAAESLGAAAIQSAEQIKAQQKALQDARKAAADTADQFFSVSAAVDAADGSVDKFIASLEQQANALVNVRENAKLAADKGIRKGLINELEKAGPAGAVILQKLANETQTQIDRANAAFKKGEDAKRSYVNFKVPPEKIVVQNAEALTAIEKIRAALANIKDKTVTVRVTRGGSEAAISPGFGPQANAAGGYIRGPGTATSDSIPSYLSNGEYVIKAAAVQKYGRNMFDGLNAMRFADGGSVSKGDKKKITREFGFSSSINTGRLEDKIADLTRRVEDQTAATEHDIATRDKWAEKMASVAEGTISGFKTGLFEKSSNPWESGAGGGPLANLTKDIAGLQERASLQTQLAGMGITGEALATLLTEGSNADLTSLIQSGQAQSTAALINQRAALQESVGAAGGQAAFGAQFAAADKTARASLDAQNRMEARLANAEGLLNSINAYMSTLGDDVGHATGFALTGAASNGQRKKNHQRGKRG